MLRFLTIAALYCCFMSSASLAAPKTTIYASEDMDYAIVLDLVTVVDPEIEQLIVDAGAESWFANKSAYLTQFSKGLIVTSLELPPMAFTEKVKWGKIRGKKRYLIFVRRVQRAELYRFGDRTPKMLCLSASQLTEPALSGDNIAPCAR